jgi:hypothetical protein
MPRVFSWCAMALLASALAAAPAQLSAEPNNAPKEGSACKVVSGVNAGKQGTYTAEGNGITDCSGSWGGSQCTNANGSSTGKCADARIVQRTTTARPIASPPTAH